MWQPELRPLHCGVGTDETHHVVTLVVQLRLSEADSAIDSTFLWRKAVCGAATTRIAATVISASATPCR